MIRRATERQCPHCGQVARLGQAVRGSVRRGDRAAEHPGRLETLERGSDPGSREASHRR